MKILLKFYFQTAEAGNTMWKFLYKSGFDKMLGGLEGAIENICRCPRLQSYKEKNGLLLSRFDIH